jgi:hypothetical protein
MVEGRIGRKKLARKAIPMPGGTFIKLTPAAASATRATTPMATAAHFQFPMRAMGLDQHLHRISIGLVDADEPGQLTHGVAVTETYLSTLAWAPSTPTTTPAKTAAQFPSGPMKSLRAPCVM